MINSGIFDPFREKVTEIGNTDFDFFNGGRRRTKYFKATRKFLTKKPRRYESLKFEMKKLCITVNH